MGAAMVESLLMALHAYDGAPTPEHRQACALAFLDVMDVPKARVYLGEALRDGRVDGLAIYRMLKREKSSGSVMEPLVTQWTVLLAQSIPQDWSWNAHLADDAASVEMGTTLLQSWGEHVLGNNQAAEILRREPRWWRLAVEQGLAAQTNAWYWRLDTILPIHPLDVDSAYVVGTVYERAFHDDSGFAQDVWRMLSKYHAEYTQAIAKAMGVWESMGFENECDAQAGLLRSLLQESVGLMVEPVAIPSLDVV